MAQETDRKLASRWGDHDSLIEGGWVGVPDSFLTNYGKLQYGLTTAEAMFVIHLMAFKWGENAPFPSYATLAQRMSITDKQARRYAKALEAKGYLRRKARIGASNSFDLQPLFDALAELVANPPAKADSKLALAKAA